MSAGTSRLGVPELRVGVPFPSIAFEIVTAVAPRGLLGRLIYLGELFDPEEAAKSRLVDEVVSADKLLARACEMADHLAAIPPETYRVTKRQLRGPVLERASQNAKMMDAEVERIWNSDEVMAAIRAYMEKTVRTRPPARERNDS
jgi:enoyl-CoA hydratase